MKRFELPHAGRVRRILLAGACGASMVIGLRPAAAQTVIPPALTRIVPDVAPDLQTGTIVTSADGTNWFISGGRYAGPASNIHQNLFDSFQYFDLRAGDSAVWSGDANALSVRNVINRISGGDPSLLYGSLIATAYPNANFYFINPAGIVFGNSFHISVPQGMYFSTASSLRFADGLTLMARTANGSSFSIAAPQSFGFVNGGADIAFDGGPLIASISTGHGALAQFSAANISLSGAKVTSGDSDLRLLAVGSSALTLPVDPIAALPTLTGRITMTGSSENLTGCLCDPASLPPLGGFGLYGGTVTVSGSTINSEAAVGSAGGRIRLQGGNVSVDTSVLSSSTRMATAGGAIEISGDAVTLRGDTVTTSTGGSGDAGAIRIDSLVGAFSDTRSVITSVASDFSTPGASPLVSGAAGDIRVNAVTGDINLTGTTIGTQAEDYSRRTGAIDILAGGDVTIRPDASTPGSGVDIFASTNSLGAHVAGSTPGGIRISGKHVAITGISSRVNRVDSYPDRVSIASTTTTDQASGDVTISASGGLDIQRSDILATAQGPLTATGAGGTLKLSGSTVSLDNVLMESSSLSGGDAGGATITATDTLTLTNYSVLSSASSGTGKAGNVAISFGSAGFIDAGSRIDSDVSGGGASAGDLVITAPQGSLVIASTGPGTPQQRITALSTSTSNVARGGAIHITVASLYLSGGAQILSAATETATGPGGSVNVDAHDITIEGTGSEIAASALSASTAGSIGLSADHISVLNGATISTDSTFGSAGAIDLVLPTTGILQVGLGAITTDSGPKSGGVITISNPLAIISNGGVISAFGQIRSASVDIHGRYFIRSSDRLNVLSVAGNLVVDSQVEDVSRGTSDIQAEFVDARQVLSGRCASAEASGVASQLGVTALGPYPAGPASAGCDQKKTAPVSSAGIPGPTAAEQQAGGSDGTASTTGLRARGMMDAGDEPDDAPASSLRTRK